LHNCLKVFARERVQAALLERARASSSSPEIGVVGEVVKTPTALSHFGDAPGCRRRSDVEDDLLATMLARKQPLTSVGGATVRFVWYLPKI